MPDMTFIYSCIVYMLLDKNRFIISRKDKNKMRLLIDYLL